ncbi:PAS domain S-box protein [Paenibacillus barcinonensis]|uniref:histidine kinase n=1 Tax=Paenibacillus barcinonensis TaxID=198119 RepID=A0A2V4V9R4_PAEBA|nr:ATP-binding protein [Paenibacillus barcinonensis]PYE42731.1 two-component system, sporulation sensor kinase E [Paenibacillus barcinonensis]QKS57928.1 PAS domain S-box protein [Paenibacillus barcinonensis]
MSIKTKLSMIMSCSVLVILILNIALSYYTTEENLRQDSENKMVLTAKQIAISVEQNQYSSDYVKRQIGNNLWLASVMAANELDPDIRKITNEELVQLSHKLGVSHISLLEQTDDDIIVSRSSDPREIGLSTKSMSYWYQAFKQLFEKQQVTIPQGQKQDHFWSDGFEYSTSSPTDIDIWGYYHDGKRNYIINPFYNNNEVDDYVKISSPDEILTKIREVNPSILEITGINPLTFASPDMGEDGRDENYRKLNDRPIRFGTYQYGSVDEDHRAVVRAVRTGQNVSFVSETHDQKVLKNFIPIFTPNKPSYVISIVMDYKQISSMVSEQLVSHASISLVLLEIVIFGSYLLAGYITRPIQSILGKVNDVADGHFDFRLKVKRKDELGQLANRINAMIRNLGHYTSRLKQMYEENRAVKEHLESIINQTADAIHITDLEGKVLRVNRAFEQLYGFRSREVEGRMLKIIPPEAAEEMARQHAQLIEGLSITSNETVWMKKDGTRVEVSVSTAPVRDEAGEITALISVSRDITNRNRMEELLRRSEKLTTVGQLAAGVAHEIRNPLTTLRGFLQLQQQSNKLNHRHLDLMLSELDRINLIVGEFLILAKPQAVHFQDRDVRFILGDVISLLDSQAHLHGVEFVLRASSDSAMVHCEENQLKQVFINVLKNGMEAMPNGGSIYIKLKLDEQAKRVRIEIRDEGIGIPEEMMPKLGEPFFTNKESGTGLGLMVSQRIIESHKGMMDIKSALNRGTTVIIELPASEQQTSLPEADQPAEEQQPDEEN